MFTLYRTPWLDRQSLELLGYTLSTAPDEIRIDVEIHYEAMQDGELTDIRRDLGLMAVPMHGIGGFITENIRIPEDSVLGNIVKHAVITQGELHNDDLFIVQPLNGKEAWREVLSLSAVGERLIIPYKKPENVEIVMPLAEVKSITQHPRFVRKERQEPPASPTTPTNSKGRQKRSPAPQRLTRE